MARPKSRERKKQYTVMLKPGLVAEMDEMCDQLGISRGQLMRNLILSGLEDAKELEKHDMVSLLNNSIMSKVRRGVLSGKYEIDDNGDFIIK